MFAIALTKPSTKRKKYVSSKQTISRGGALATSDLYSAAHFQTREQAEFFLKNCTPISLGRIVELVAK